MRAVRFKLSGKTAFFKKPDVNAFLYFTYSNIHKVALLGMLGAILGYKGYERQKAKQMYPEFYEQLKDLPVAILPENNPNQKIPGLFGKKVQTFNNSVGYASGEAGGNLIIKEQWLENPSWEIIIASEHPCYDILKSRLLNSQAVYIPYLGKNDHPATISEVREIEVTSIEGAARFHSLCLKDEFKILEDDDDDDEWEDEEEKLFKYEEKLPIALEPEQNQYKLATFILTNYKMTAISQRKLYQTEDQKNICFI